MLYDVTDEIILVGEYMEEVYETSGQNEWSTNTWSEKIHNK